MDQRALWLIAIVALPTVLAGCIGSSSSESYPGDDLSINNIERTGRTVEIDMWVETVRTELYPGFTAELWAFCMRALPGSEDTLLLRGDDPCSVPGPTLLLDQGDKLVVNFENRHGFSHTVHWHGQLVPWHQDGVPGSTQDTVEQGQAYTYEYLVKRAGTLMYHCHVDTQHHVFMGLYGAIIVDPQDQSLEPEADQDYTLVISNGEKDHMRVPGPNDDPHAMHRGGFGSGDPDKQNAAFNVDYDLFLFNGKAYPNTLADPQTLVKVNEGDDVRVRFVHIGFEAETVRVDGHQMLVTHKDGIPYHEAARKLVDEITLAPGERYDVLIKADKPGKWALGTKISKHMTNAHEFPGGLLTQLVYAGHEDAPFELERPDDLPEPPAKEAPMPADVNQRETGEVTDVQYSRSFAFPVEDTRAERVSLVMTLTAGTPLDAVTVRLLDAEGNERGAGEYNQNTPDGAITITSIPNTGAWTATVEGHALGATYTLDIIVDYPDAAGDGHGGHAH